jgi:hypothetical protein
MDPSVSGDNRLIHKIHYRISTTFLKIIFYTKEQKRKVAFIFCLDNGVHFKTMGSLQTKSTYFASLRLCVEFFQQLIHLKVFA